MMRILAIGCWAWLGLATFAFALEPEARTSEPIRYFKLIVPEKVLDEKPTIAKGFSYYPREDFWKLLEAAQRSRGGATFTAGPRITRATYRARWSREQGLKGDEARLEVAAGADSSTLLSLEPLGIAVGNAIWDEEPPRPALIGLSSQGTSAVLVDRSSILTFPWSLRGKPGVAEHAFELALPSAAVQKLTLELPAAWRPTVPGAIVTRDEMDSESSLATWQIELGQQTPVHLTLVNPQDPASQPLVLLREASAVNLSAAGLDMTTTFTLDIHHQPLSRLVVAYPAGLDIASIRVGDKSLPFKLLTGQSDEQRIAIDLPDPLLGVLRVVSIQAIMPWMPGKPLSLPRLSVEGAVWQEGAANLSLAPTLELARLTISGGRQTGVVPVAGVGGESYQLQFFSPQAKADILVHRLSPALRIESLGHLELDPAQVSAVLTSRIQAERGETFDLQLDVSREWLVDSLDTTPADAIEDRTFIQAADGGQVLQLRLKQAVREDQELRLVVRARRRGAAVGEELGADQFRFLRFLGEVNERRTLTVGAADNAYMVRASGDAALRRVAVADLPPIELGTASRMEEQLAFIDDDLADSVRLQLQTEQPQFAATMKVQATVDRDQVEHVYRVRLQPQGAALSEMLVRFGLPLTQPVEWEFEDSEEPIVAQRIESPTDTATDSGETWRLRWKRARAESFEVAARARSGFSGTLPLNWLSAPAAAAQTGVIEIGAENGQLLQIEAPDLDAIPTSAQNATARAAYRYDPSRRLQVTLARQVPTEGQATLLVHALQVQTQFQLDGRARHAASAVIEDLGIGEIQLQVPDAEGGIEWVVNGRQVAAIPAANASGTWRVPLPEDAGRATLEFVYSTPGQPIGWLGWRSWRIRFPQFEAPVLASVWQAELPPGVVKIDEGWLPTTIPEIGQRLLGPLWRNSGYSFLGVGNSTYGWSKFEKPTAQDEALLPICYAPASDVWGWVCLFGMLALWMASRARPFTLSLSAGLLAVLTLVLPWVCVPWASGALLGTLIAMLVRTLALPLAPAGEPYRASAAVPGALTACLLLGVYGGAWLAVAGAQPPAGVKSDKVTPSARRIIVPINEEGEELRYVYVEPAFHDQLQRLATAPAAGSAIWLARSADYRLDFQAPEGNGKRRLESLTAVFQVELLTNEANFRLPFDRNKIHLLPDGVSVDRTGIAADWTDDETELRIPLRGAGSHQVEIKLRPVLQPDGDYERLDLTIPPIAGAQLTVAGSVPAELELLKSAGSLAPASGAEGLSARLGPTERLQMRWSPAGDDASVTTTEANQWVWRMSVGMPALSSSTLPMRDLAGVAIGISNRSRVVSSSVASHRRARRFCPKLPV